MSERDFPTLTPTGQLPKLDSIFDVSAKFLGELRLWLEMNPPALPITSVLGFNQFTAQLARTASAQTTTSTAYTDLATVGPTLSGLAPGKYIVLVSAVTVNNTATVGSLMSPSVNGSAPNDADAAMLVASGANVPQGTVVGMSLQTLSLDNNEIKAKYRVVSASTGTWNYRNLLALKYSNL